MPYSVRITCTVHQAVISIEHLAVARASFFVLAVYKKKLLYTVKLQTCNCIIFQGFQHTKFVSFSKPQPRVSS